MIAQHTTRRLFARLRGAVRSDEVWLTLVATCLGAMAGALVGGLNMLAQEAHEILFALPPGQRLSAMVAISPWRALLVPSTGGVLIGAATWYFSRVRPTRAVDPIEANALYGGHMSLNDSLVMIGQILLSNACGASVGLEAGYTQMGGAIGSRLGRAFGVRRRDLRLLVGCGAAGAIASAFNAPLTGAFYGFELVIGSYALNSLAPVVSAAIAATIVSQKLFISGASFAPSMPAQLRPTDFALVLALGFVAALAGIGIMRAVSFAETVFKFARVPVFARPGVGGLLVGALAFVTPAVMSGGHGAMRLTFGQALPFSVLAALFVFKACASAISLGAGFRGGLFFASLLLGSLLGKMFSAATLLLPPAWIATSVLPEPVYALIGMSALATAIIGGPLTMTFLALESTASLPLASVVLAASVVSSLTVRRLFGYSFATWRFHLRGETIRSAADIGWIRTLTVDSMMRRDLACVVQSETLDGFCAKFPLGSTNRVVVVDDNAHYAGIVWLAEAHSPHPAGTSVGDIMHRVVSVLYPVLTVKDAIDIFADAGADALAVVESSKNPRVLGLLNEHYALRRYSEELDKHRRDLSGE